MFTCALTGYSLTTLTSSFIVELRREKPSGLQSVKRFSATMILKSYGN
jgi:hypothetical protein